MRYALNEVPPVPAFLLYGLQWWIVTLPSVVIAGVVVARLHYPEAADQVLYLRKLFALTGAATMVQVLFGHRLPLVVGPATILLIGLIASLASGVDALYTAVFLGGACLAVAGFSGLFSRVRRFFTPRIIAVVIALIAFTLAPTILGLIFSGPASRAVAHFCFALGGAAGLVFLNERLPGVAKSLTVLFGMAGGTLMYFAVWGFPALAPLAPASSHALLIAPAFDAGTVLAFVFCFLALAINDLGSIEAIGHMLGADGMDGRIRRGVGLTGIANMFCGAAGVIGPVNFSMSAGVIGATGCASRFPLALAGLPLALCALFPSVIQALAAIPGPVMGMLFLYLMASQLASGLTVLVREKSVADFPSGITVALPLMTGLLVAFMPKDAFNALPDLIRPILGNGFVMGTLAVIFLEHAVFAKHRPVDQD